MTSLTTMHVPPIAANILVVDDSEDNLAALAAVIEEDGVTCLTARSGADALALVRTAEIALAIVDVQMPDMDGFMLAEALRGTEAIATVPIIFVTGARDAKRVFRGYEAGAVDFLFKPLEAHVISNKVHTFVELYRQKKRLAQQLKALEEANKERDRLVEELQEQLKLNDRFVAVLGHDLRNPLAAMMTTAELLERRAEDPRIRHGISRLRVTGARMTRMINDILDFARARQTNGIPLLVREVDLDDVVRRAIDEANLVYQDRVIDVVTRGSLHGVWDEDRLEQVLSNLLANAVEHGEDNQPVGVIVDGEDPDCVEVAVSNAGEIPDDAMPSLFDPFRPRRSNAKKCGLGLGLYIVQQIALAHGGTVRAMSSAEAGTAIVIRLPRISEGASLDFHHMAMAAPAR